MGNKFTGFMNIRKWSCIALLLPFVSFFPPGGPDGQWRTVYTGTSVGHKHIAIFDTPVTAKAVLS